MEKPFRAFRSLVARTPLRAAAATGAIGLLIGAAAGAALAGGSPPGAAPLRLSQSDSSLINPLLICDVNEQKNFNEDKSLESVVKGFVNGRIAAGLATDISVYVIDYRTGAWTGVNENDPYDPASLLKVPLLIAYYQMAEKDPAVLSRTLSFSGSDQNAGEYFRSTNDIRAGQPYTADELLQSMIANSDNTAAALLQQSADQNSLSEVFTDLGLPVPGQTSGPDYISAKRYAYFFRVLYNATYLDRAYSEKALELLSQPDFPQGIRGGLPAGTVAAQKFGERTLANADGSVVDRQLHDCGIVYKPGSPYLICIMSRSASANFDTLAKNIRDLSALVYQTIR